MSLRHDQLPQDVEQLSRMVLDLRAEVAYLKRLIHGARSEGLSTIDPAQTSLNLDDLSAVPVAANDDQPDGPRHKARGRQSAPRNIGFLPKHLPRYDVIIERKAALAPVARARSITLERRRARHSMSFRPFCASNEPFALAMPAGHARMVSSRLPRRRASWMAAWRRQHWRPISSFPSSRGTFRSTGRPRSSRAMG